MKKYTLLIIAGGIFLIAGLFLSLGKKKEQIIYYVESTISQDEAISLIIEKTKSIMDVYENQNDTFKISNKKTVEDDTEKEEQTTEEPQEPVDLYNKVDNYDEVIDEIYTKSGKEELESTTFNNNLFVKKSDDGVFLLKEIPKDNKYSTSSISVSDIIIKSDSVKAKVSFTRDELDDKNALNYYIYEKNIEIVIENDKWLVNSFKYSNK